LDISTHPCLLELPPNRVRRYYRGGAVLDALEGKPEPEDSNRPENWLCSLVEASNPDMPPIPHEGLSRVCVRGKELLLRDLIEFSPEHYLGAGRGRQTGFLAKLLDSSSRLALQAHPTREFAHRELGKPWGKFECYVVLSVRPDVDPHLYLGFQHPPSPEEWLRMVTEQDLPAMLACFDKIPVQPGDAWYVPGGFPHALGGGITVLEVMEPSDLVVRCEFESGGYLIPPASRFMGLPPAEALRVLDYSACPVESVRANYRVEPELLAETGSLTECRRIGPGQIDCFEVRELRVCSHTNYDLAGRYALLIVADGTARLCHGAEALTLYKGASCLVAAASNQISIEPSGPDPLRLLLCVPGTV